MNKFEGNYEITPTAKEKLYTMSEREYYWYIGGMSMARSLLEEIKLNEELVSANFSIGEVTDVNGERAHWVLK